MVAEEQQIINIILIGIGLLMLMSVAVVVFFYFSRRRVIKAELEKANMELAHQKEVLKSVIITQEEERQRIAQDMHDAISSKLNVVSLNANMLSDIAVSTEEANKIGSNILKVTTTVLESSRKIAHDLLPPTLQKFGLNAAVEELCDEVAETGRFQVKYKADYGGGAITSAQELHLFRIAQELFNNAIKYSEAATIGLELKQHEQQVILTYSDDGKGFEISEARKAKGLGMSGIENRVAILGAEWTLRSSPGNGLFVQISKQLR